MEFSAYFEAIVPGEQKNEKCLTIPVKRIYVCRRQSDQTGKTYNKVVYLIDAVKAHVCMRSVVWYINSSNKFYYTIPSSTDMNKYMYATATTSGAVVAETTAALFSTLKRHTFDAAVPGIQKPKELNSDFHGQSFLGCLCQEIMKVKTVKSRVSKKNEFLRWGFVKIHALVTRIS